MTRNGENPAGIGRVSVLARSVMAEAATRRRRRVAVFADLASAAAL
jgi:hypothetical protein